MNIVAIGIKPVARIRQKHHIHRLHFHLASKWCSMGSGLRLESGVATWGRQHLGLKSDCRLLPRQFRTYWLGMVCRDSWVQQSTRSWKRSCWPEDGSATWLGRHLGRVWPWSLLVLRLKKVGRERGRFFPTWNSQKHHSLKNHFIQAAISVRLELNLFFNSDVNRLGLKSDLTLEEKRRDLQEQQGFVFLSFLSSQQLSSQQHLH